MPTPHFNYYPPSGAVLDQNEPKAYWNGTSWQKDRKTYAVPSGHRLVGRAGGPLNGWYYDWSQRAWMEPDNGRSTYALGNGTPVRGRPGLVPRPVAAPPAQLQTPVLVPVKDTCVNQTKQQTALDYVRNHPAAPLIGAGLIVISSFVDAPSPPEIPDDLSPLLREKWKMIYEQNLARHAQRMQLLNEVGSVLLNQAAANAVLTALPAKRAA